MNRLYSKKAICFFLVVFLTIHLNSCSSLRIKVNNKEQIYPSNSDICKRNSNLILNDSISLPLNSIQSIIYQDEVLWSLGAIGGGTLGFLTGTLIGYPVGKAICPNNGVSEYDNETVSACGFVPIASMATIFGIAGIYYGGQFVGTHSQNLASIDNCKN
jgi:hypothetical protein